MQMSGNLCINLTVSNQISVFADKGAVQHEILMMRSHYLKCRQMVCNRHDMGYCTLLDAFPNKVDTGLIHPVEHLSLQQRLAKLDLAEIIHAFPHEILIIRGDSRPQRTQDDVGVIAADYLVLIVADIIPEPPPLQAPFHHIGIVVIFVVAGDNQHLPVVSRSLFPELANTGTVSL